MTTPRPSPGARPQSAQPARSGTRPPPSPGRNPDRETTPNRNDRFTQQQMYDLLIRAGATPQEATTLAAIGMAESGGRPDASNLSDPHGGSHGLWQINGVHTKDFATLKDPVKNAQWAVRLLRRDGVSIWGAYTNGSYRQFLPQGAGAKPDGRPVPAAGMPSGASEGAVKAAIDLGMSFIGQPYKWGGDSPEEGFDCSGLIQYIYGRHGVKLPRVSAEQARAGVAVSARTAQAGDLIAFDNDPNRPGVDHIGIYLGDGKMLQAPRTGRNIEVVAVNLDRAAAIRRVAPPDGYRGLNRNGSTYVYPATVGQAATDPSTITAGTGGGDESGVPGYDPSSMLGADGQVDPDKAIGTYGYIAELANSVPEIRSTLTRAIMEGWEPVRFQAELQRTNWWRTTSDNQRQVELLKKTNPGEYRRQRQQMIDRINILARQYGAREGTQRVFILAERFLSLGSTDAEIERLIAADVRVAPTGSDQQNTGAAAVTVDNLRGRARTQRITLTDPVLQQWVSNILRGDLSVEAFDSYLLAQARKQNPDIPVSAFERGMTVDAYRQQESQTLEALRSQAKKYMLPMSEETLRKWAGQISAGDVMPEAFTDYLKSQAKSLRPGLSEAIDRGITPEDYFEPYRQVAAQTLEVAPDQVDFTNPMYEAAIDRVDPATGKRGPMSLNDYRVYLRGRPEYRKTRQGQQMGAEFVNSLTETFGKVAF